MVFTATSEFVADAGKEGLYIFTQIIGGIPRAADHIGSVKIEVQRAVGARFHSVTGIVFIEDRLDAAEEPRAFGDRVIVFRADGPCIGIVTSLIVEISTGDHPQTAGNRRGSTDLPHDETAGTVFFIPPISFRSEARVS